MGVRQWASGKSLERTPKLYKIKMNWIETWEKLNEKAIYCCNCFTSQWFLSSNDLFFIWLLLLGLSPPCSQLIIFLLNLPLVCNYWLYCRIALRPNFPTETSHFIWSAWRPANVLLSTDEGEVRLRQAAELWTKDLRWSPGATDGRPVLPLQSLGTFLSTGYASGGCRAPLNHKQAQICKRTVNKDSVKVAIERVTACVGPHGPICAASWPRLFGLQVLTDTRGLNYRGQVCNLLVCCTHFCLFFIYLINVMSRHPVKLLQMFLVLKRRF